MGELWRGLKDGGALERVGRWRNFRILRGMNVCGFWKNFEMGLVKEIHSLRKGFGLRLVVWEFVGLDKFKKS